MEKIHVFFLLIALASLVSSQQPYVSNNFYYTSQRIYNELYAKDALFSVQMRYDLTYDPLYGGILKGWSPPLNYWWWSSYWKQYLEPSSCLGINGPIGPYGPLSNRGPLDGASYTPGTNWWDYYLSSLLAWNSMAGALGPLGPLGQNGPITNLQIYLTMYHLNEVPYAANAFPMNLDITGVWGVLGPLSTLGALGPLGPLGILGPYGTSRDSNGNYLVGGKVARNVTVQFDSYIPTTYRIYSLHEKYPKSYAQTLGFNNDASFTADGTFVGTNPDDYNLTNPLRQIVTIMAIPRFPLSSNPTTLPIIKIEVFKVNPNGSNTLLASSSLSSYVNFVVVNLEKDDKIKVRLTPVGPINPVDYRLFVTGSGFWEYIQLSNIKVANFLHRNIVGSYQTTY